MSTAKSILSIHVTISEQYILRKLHDFHSYALIQQHPTKALLDIIYLDDALLAVNKPAGLLTVPGRGPDKQDCLSSRVQKVFPDALVAHRLDMATSGLVLFPRGVNLQRYFSRMFRMHEVQKHYEAIVEGKLSRDFGEVDLPIIVDWPNRPLRKIDNNIGKPSLTRFRLLEYDKCAHTSRVELEPVTGRTHQLRVHMAAVGHPIKGDALYGKTTGNASERLLLHAYRLSFIHPIKGEVLDLLCETSF